LLAVIVGSIVACGALASVASKLGLQAAWLSVTDTKTSAYCERHTCCYLGPVRNRLVLFRASEDAKTVY
jgi:hypothetical protein